MLTKSDRTKQFIIEKAAPLFNTKGYSATSMSDLIAVTGLAKGGIYGNFGSKDEIAAAAFEFAMNKVREAIRFKINQQPDARGKLFAVLDFYRNYTVNPPVAGGCPLLNTATEADDNLPFLKAHAAKAMKEMLKTLELLIVSGKAAGQFLPKVSESAEAAFIFATIEGGIMMSKLQGNSRVLNEVLEILRERIMNYGKSNKKPIGLK